MLQISVSTDGNGGTGSVDIFDCTSISHDDAGLQFFDERYAQSGRHSMDEFYVDLYDGKGYDGEPLVTCYYYFTESDDQDAARGAMTSIPDSGPGDPPEPGVVPTEAKIVIFGKWTDKCKAEFEIPNPSSAESLTTPQGPLTVVFQADDLPPYPPEPVGPEDANAIDVYMQIYRSVGQDVIYKRYEHDAYSLRCLVNDLECFHYAARSAAGQEIPIENIVIFNHSTLGTFSIGIDQITRFNYTEQTTGLCKRINEVTCLESQIQYHGCSTAGIDVFRKEFDPFAAESKREENLENWSWWGRTLGMIIAIESGTTFFSSSDTDMYTVVYDDSGHPLGRPVDMCLEFGVDPDGIQVDYQICDWEWLDYTKWLAVGTGWDVVASSSDVQSSFDSPDADIDYTDSSGNSSTFKWHTPGENDGINYLTIYQETLERLQKSRRSSGS